jgi:hypothetical protein
MRTLRLWVGAIGAIGAAVSLLLVGFAIILLVFEVSFGFKAVPTTATVENYAASSGIFGQGKADVVHEVDGRPVKATLRTSLFFRPGQGERVAVLYVPAEPDRVESDGFLQRFGPVAIPLGLAMVVAYSAGVFGLLRGTQGYGQQGGVGGSRAAPGTSPAGDTALT